MESFNAAILPTESSLKRKTRWDEKEKLNAPTDCKRTPNPRKFIPLDLSAAKKERVADMVSELEPVKVQKIYVTKTEEKKKKQKKTGNN